MRKQSSHKLPPCAVPSEYEFPRPEIRLLEEITQRCNALNKLGGIRVFRGQGVFEDDDLLRAAGCGAPHHERHVGGAPEGVDEAAAVEVEERRPGFVIRRGGDEKVKGWRGNASVGSPGASPGIESDRVVVDAMFIAVA
jgi:hypothetical protein